jgi:hypothetical protein
VGDAPGRHWARPRLTNKGGATQGTPTSSRRPARTQEVQIACPRSDDATLPKAEIPDAICAYRGGVTHFLG